MLFALSIRNGLWTAGECPSVFKLPAQTPGAGPAPAGAGTPTHVVKSSHGGKDWMCVGSYSAGPPKVLGTFKPTSGVPNKEVIVDAGALYASKVRRHVFFTSRSRAHSLCV